MDNLNDNIMYFVNDDEFAKFCIDPAINIYSIDLQNGEKQYLSSFNFTKQYLDAIDNGIKFCIQDLHSHVNKDGYLGFRGCTKKIDNIERYYED